jgi:hypothetical protein
MLKKGSAIQSTFNLKTDSAENLIIIKFSVASELGFKPPRISNPKGYAVKQGKSCED